MAKKKKPVKRIVAPSVRRRKEVTKEAMIEEFDEAIGLAKTYRQPSAMVAAIKAKAQLVGLLIEKKETTHSGQVGVVASVARVDLDERTNQLAGEAVADALLKALA